MCLVGDIAYAPQQRHTQIYNGTFISHVHVGYVIYGDGYSPVGKRQS